MSSDSNQGILNLVLIGAKNSGKTVFLSTLWGKGLLLDRDVETKEYLKNNWDYIESNHKAQATSGTLKILNFSYQHDTFGRITFSIDDYDGKFTETISQDDENTRAEREKLKQSIKESEGCIFFIPFEETPERLKEFSQEIDAFIELAQFSNKNKSPIPASIVITKWDESEYFKDAQEKNKALDYIKSNEYLTRAVKLIKSHFEFTELISLSSFENHNLLTPIDFSLENTFLQWFNRANELQKLAEYEKLCRYLSIRWEDVKFNSKYDFKTIYEIAQFQFSKIIDSGFSKKLSLKDKEEYILQYKDYFKTKPELYHNIEIKINDEKNKSKRRKILLGLLITTFTVVAAVLIYLNITKINVTEKYNKIIKSYNMGQTYKDLKQPIDEFLSNYRSSNFFLILLDIQKIREDINKIKIELENNQKQIKDNILKDNRSVIEKENELKRTTTLDTKEINVVLASKKNEEKLNNWKYTVNLCIENECINNVESLQKVSKLLEDAENFVQDNVVRNLKEKLVTLKQSIELQISLFDIKNFNELFQLSKKRSYDVDESRKIIDKICEIVKCKQNYTNEMIKKFGITTILDDISNELELTKSYDNLLENISRSTLEELQNLKVQAFSQYDISQKKNITIKLEQRLNEILSENIINSIPDDIFDKSANKSWKESYEEFNNLINFGQFDNYTYNPEKYQKYYKIKDRLAVINTLEELRENGINTIQVSIQGYESNSIDLGCRSTWYGKEKENAILKGFSTDLTYKNDAVECSNNKITYINSSINIKEEKYDLELFIERFVMNSDTIKESIKFEISDLYDLNNLKNISKSIDAGQIILRFSKKQ